MSSAASTYRLMKGIEPEVGEGISKSMALNTYSHSYISMSGSDRIHILFTRA